jgi:hypothetical protein
MWPPSAAGTRPFDKQQTAFLVEPHDRSVWTVGVTLPVLAGHPLAGNTRPGSCAMLIEPGRIVLSASCLCDADEFGAELWRANE